MATIQGIKYDLTGQRFGFLTVVGLDGIRTNGASYWRCRCDCGAEPTVRGSNLRRGDTKSCGCKKQEFRRAYMVTHGLSQSPEFVAWSNMKSRCLNPKCPGYKRYGGRGIRICDEWLNSFETFFADMGPRPGAEYSIERKDSNGNYEPGNCVWATCDEQARSRRTSVLLTFRGETLSVEEWGRRLNISGAAIRHRIRRLKWTVEQTLTTASRKRGQ